MFFQAEDELVMESDQKIKIKMNCLFSFSFLFFFFVLFDEKEKKIHFRLLLSHTDYTGDLKIKEFNLLS